VTIGGVAPPFDADGFQEIACPDAPGDVGPVPFEDSDDCCRSKKRLGLLVDKDCEPILDENGDTQWPWILCEEDGVCKHIPDIDLLLLSGEKAKCLLECPTYTRTIISTVTLPNVTPVQIGPPFDITTLNTTLLAAEVCAPLETNTTGCNMRCRVTIDGSDVGVRNLDGSIILVGGWKVTVNVNGATVVEEFRRSYQNGNPSPNFSVSAPTSFNYVQTLAPGDTLEVCLQPYAFFGQSGTPEEVFMQFLQPDIQIDCEPTPC